MYPPGITQSIDMLGPHDDDGRQQLKQREQAIHEVGGVSVSMRSCLNPTERIKALAKEIASIKPDEAGKGSGTETKVRITIPAALLIIAEPVNAASTSRLSRKTSRGIDETAQLPIFAAAADQQIGKLAVNQGVTNVQLLLAWLLTIDKCVQTLRAADSRTQRRRHSGLNAS